MELEGFLGGERKEYPIEIKINTGIGFITKIIKSDEQLIQLIEEYKESEINKEKKLSQIFKELGINAGQLADHRTRDILNNYEFYKQAPHLAFDNQIWFDSVILLNKIEPRLI